MTTLPKMAFMPDETEKIISGRKTITIRKALPRGIKLNSDCEISIRKIGNKSKLLGTANIASISNILIYRDKILFINKRPKLITKENIALGDGFDNFNELVKFYFNSLIDYPEIYPCVNYYLIEFNNFIQNENSKIII